MTDSTPVCSDSASSESSLLIGIDVAKQSLDLARSDTDAVVSFDNNAAGHRRLLASLAGAKPAVIVVESTGGLERPLLEALLEADLNVALVNPSKVRHLAKGLGILAKTDKIDARLLVEFARAARPRLLEKRSANQVQLQALVTCRRQLQRSLTEQTNRLGSTRVKSAVQALQAVIKTLQKQIGSLDEQIRRLIDSDDSFKDLDRLICSVPGIGPVGSAMLMAMLPELGKVDRRQLPALVGVAPYNDDSGRTRGQRSIRGGRTDLRCVLYMGTLSAMRFNPIIKTFAIRLRAAGKRSKVVIVACMRKLSVLLNAMVRENLLWNQLNLVKNA